jgi:hypothetical protein
MARLDFVEVPAFFAGNQNPFYEIGSNRSAAENEEIGYVFL